MRGLKFDLVSAAWGAGTLYALAFAYQLWRAFA